MQGKVLLGQKRFSHRSHQPQLVTDPDVAIADQRDHRLELSVAVHRADADLNHHKVATPSRVV